LISSTLLFSETVNNQAMYNARDPLFSIIRDLSIEQGLSAPSSSGPWSGEELASMLETIDADSLSPDSSSLYEYASERLSAPDRKQVTPRFGYDFQTDTTAEIYAHTNDSSYFELEEDWGDAYPERKPLLSTSLAFWGDTSMYGKLNVSLRNNRFGFGTQSSAAYFQPGFSTNVLIDKENFLLNYETSFPWTAFISIGGSVWNFQFGRDTLSWGNGVTGNLIIDDHLIFHEFARFTTFYKPFKYSLLAVSFPHPANYYSGEYDGPDGYPLEKDQLSGVRTFIAHRFEFTLNSKIRLSLTEAMMHQAETYDFRFFSPFVIQHNYFMKENSNSILGVELDYTVLPSLLFHTQVVIDDLAVGGETTSGDKAKPDAVGVISALHYTKAVNKGMLRLSVEGAYTTPYLYLRGSELSGDTGEPIDFIVGYPQYTQKTGNLVKKEFLGYRYGGDAIVVDFATSFMIPESWQINAGAFYMAHGTFDIETPYDKGDDARQETTPTEDNAVDPEKNSVESTLIISMGGSVHLHASISVSTSLNWVTRWNPDNISREEPVSDLQGSFGITLSL
jgi:hypothetical protein